MRLRGKRAIITGGANGIGQATAMMFAREGAQVVIADVDTEAGQSTCQAILDQNGKAEFVETDVTDAESVTRLVEQTVSLLDGVDILMSNAGTSMTEDLLDISPEAWRADLELNLSSHYLCAQAVLRQMIEGDGGSLIFTSSVNAIWSIGECGYSAAKAGLISLAKNIAIKYGKDGIRANVICPGTIDTPRGGAYWDQKSGAKEKLLKWYPAGRLGRPEDIAYLATYLASDESTFVSGANIVIDGGLTAGSTLFGQ